MTRTRHVVLVASAVLLLGACAGLRGGAASTGPLEPPPDLADRLAFVGIAPDLVYVTDVEGFDLATQSVGVSGDEGMSAAYVGAAGMVMLTTSRDATPGVAPCADLADAAGPSVQCTGERDGAYVLLDGDGVEPAVLRAAGEAVRVPREDELDALFADLPEVSEPVERGDLPPGGDGAPVDPPGVGG
ncbi:hypothetical protein [Cellulomonas sp. S1-8]|uniref:hypothetical protein n=1 Tax=Cellulomonas sp. S1-8 TaxID=2904790 RepID=UPI002244E53B|nr:hypothetical protein [Cellulomonas sp. S1-8]UZN03699.1 hypothetical protein OKX07_01775 [Cellulomonas sp. S1-8]